MADRVGEQFGNYRLLRLLGRGGFAEVYLGAHCLLKSLAAVKILRTSLSEKETDNFLKEAQTLAKLTHPHIIKVLDFDVLQSIPYLVLDYASGGTLRQRHPRGSLVPLGTIVSYVKEVSDALQYAHEAKIVHRDIKPENMLLDELGTVLLGDFGIALLLQTLQAQSLQQIAGTAVYMAPEQFQGKAQRASDQYALGIVTYEWLSGEHPFRGSFSEIASQHLLVPPPSLRSKVPSIAPDTEAVILKALAKDPLARFADIWEFAIALEQAHLASEPRDGAAFTSGIAFHPAAAMAQVADDVWANVPTHLSTTVPAIPSPLHQFSVAQLPLHNTPSSAPSPQQTVPLLPQPMVIPSRKRHSRVGAALIAVALLIVLVGCFNLFYSSVSTHLRAPITTTRSIARIGASITAVAQVKATANALATVNARDYATATANGIMFGFDPQHTQFDPAEHLLSPSNVSKLKLAWKVPVGGPVSTSSPIVSNGVVYVGSINSNLYAFNALTGTFIWKAQTGGAIYSTPAVVNGIIYVGSLDGSLYAFHTATGGKLWSTSVNSPIYSSPIVANNLVYILSTDDTLHAVDASTGTLLWSVLSNQPGLQTITSSPAVAGTLVYVGSVDGNLYAFDARTGILRWKVPIQRDLSTSPAVADGMVYISSGSILYSFDASNGKTIWTFTSTQVAYSAPAVADGTIYVSATDGNLHAFDAKTGKQSQQLSQGASNLNNFNEFPPIVANGVVYAAPTDGALSAYAAATSNILWAVGIEPDVLASPTVANGMVYIGTTQGYLFSFGLPTNP